MILAYEPGEGENTRSDFDSPPPDDRGNSTFSERTKLKMDCDARLLLVRLSADDELPSESGSTFEEIDVKDFELAIDFKPAYAN